MLRIGNVCKDMTIRRCGFLPVFFSENYKLRISGMVFSRSDEFDVRCSLSARQIAEDRFLCLKIINFSG